MYSVCVAVISLSPFPPSLFYSLPAAAAEAATITATSTCLLTVSRGEGRCTEGGSSSRLPATMGENCLGDREGDREMKGRGGGARGESDVDV